MFEYYAYLLVMLGFNCYSLFILAWVPGFRLRFVYFLYLYAEQMKLIVLVSM